jgi:homocysteine S-methyltransferase
MDDEVIDIRVERPMRDDTTNSFWDKLSAGKKVIAVEYDPPTNDAVGIYLEGVRHLRPAGVDAITIADCPVGIPRVDSSLIACKLKRELEIEPIPHMTCRDRNLNAIKALLLGLSVEDVHNVLLVTGDPMPTDLHEEVKSVFNCNSRKLAKFVSSLDENSVDTPFKIYAALNINAKNFNIQLKIAKEKEEN